MIFPVKLYNDRPSVKINNNSSNTTPQILNVRKKYSVDKGDRRKLLFDTVVISRTEYLDLDFKLALIKWFNLFCRK
jgi:hypothetical protein